MRLPSLTRFNEIWVVDFEFSAAPGERPVPICLVAREERDGRSLRLWQDELSTFPTPPYSVGHDSLLVAYYASAELGCHLALGWPLPVNVLDLFCEFRNLANGRTPPCGFGLLSALTAFGLSGIEMVEKQTMRELAQRGGPWSLPQREQLMDYCESDVAALHKLLHPMSPHLDVPRALLRGRYMKAAAHIEHRGVPIDTRSYSTLRDHWPDIQDKLIDRIDANYGVYEGRSFILDRFRRWLVKHGIPWPRLESGRLALDDNTFREMARIHPEVAPLRELRVALSQMRLSNLAIGKDGRNRCLLSAFQARTGRNQPSNSQFIFGPAVWLRGLIRPQPGWGLAYIDYCQQEFGIAAALSGDPAMMEAASSGDPYLAFAKQVRAVPSDATKQSHGREREMFKACSLAVQYEMGPKSLAQRVGRPEIEARDLLAMHRQTYPVFWRWSDSVVDYAMLYGKLWTVFGWEIHVGSGVNPRFLRNFPMQANGAEMLRLACCLATERGIRVCAPIHDAILIEAPLLELEDAVAETQLAMAEASEVVLNGVQIRTEAKVIRYPDRYMDERGREMWTTVWEIVREPNSVRCA